MWQQKCLTINRMYERRCSKHDAEIFFQNQHFHKLSWKWWGNTEYAELFLTDADGEATWLGRLFQHNAIVK